MNAPDLKQIHEESSCRRFLSIYNLEQGRNFLFLRQGDSNKKEPDCICSNNLGIELVGIYDNSYQAEKIWNEARERLTKQQTNIKLLTLGNLQSEIGKKLQKLGEGNYGGFSGKIILVCNLHSPLLQTAEVEQYIGEYAPFRADFDKHFEEIWLSWKAENTGDWKIRKLE
jgi:hypothetical protein